MLIPLFSGHSKNLINSHSLILSSLGLSAATWVSQLSLPMTYLCLSDFVSLLTQTVLEMSSFAIVPISLSHISLSLLLLNVKSKVKSCKILQVLLRFF